MGAKPDPHSVVVINKQATGAQVATEISAGSELQPTGLPTKLWILPFVRSKDIENKSKIE